MKLKRAVEILTMFVQGSWPGPAKDFDDAANLLIEAFIRLKGLRELGIEPAMPLLPGEEADDA